ncbi:MAG TPA: WD40 repeat domain-containing protein [Thermomicrobiales bacterium]|nr:WD40 repeat domain-containing protein [Thermomicrobiales bacterium]
MPDVRRRCSPRQPELSRRRAFQVAGGAGAAIAGIAAGAPGVAAQATPGATPASSPAASGRSVASWFVVSPQDPGGGFTTSADVFEVYSGVTLEKLGGFRAPGTVGMCVTADPGRILLATATGAAIFDLRSGKVRDIDLNGSAFTGPAWLPDPRIFPVAPPRWAVLRSTDYSQCWLVDLDEASAVDLVPLFADRGNAATFPAVAFSPDGRRAVARIDEGGAVLFDPEQPEGFRRLDGGATGSVAGQPVFSASGEHIVYTVSASNQAVEARVVIEAVSDGSIVAEVGGVSPAVFAAFLPDSESTILLTGDGETVVVDTANGRDLIDVESGPLAYGYGFSSDGRYVLAGASDLSGEEMRWQKLDLTTGEEEEIAELEALTFYNGSYGGDAANTLFGPPYLAQGEEVVDALVGFNTETMTATPLLDDVSSWDLAYGYSTSADSRIALFVAYDATLMNLETGDVTTFPGITTGSSSHGSFVSPDGAKAAISAWDTSGSGTQRVLMLDVDAGGDPEPFADGVLWLWAGELPAVAAGASRGLTYSGSRWTGLRTIGRR